MIYSFYLEVASVVHLKMYLDPLNATVWKTAILSYLLVNKARPPSPAVSLATPGSLEILSSASPILVYLLFMVRCMF